MLLDKYNEILNFCKGRTEIAKTDGISLSWEQPFNMALSYKCLSDREPSISIKIEFAKGSRYAYRVESIGCDSIVKLSLVNVSTNFTVMSSDNVDLRNEDGIQICIVTYILETVYKLTVENLEKYLSN